LGFFDLVEKPILQYWRRRRAEKVCRSSGETLAPASLLLIPAWRPPVSPAVVLKKRFEEESLLKLVSRLLEVKTSVEEIV